MKTKIITTLLMTIAAINLAAQITINEPAGDIKDLKKTDIAGINLISYTLPNGMKIYLNEDHNKNDVLGAVIVKGGSKFDPKNATGIAHYLEHMLFKGTDKIGTTDYKAEKIWLDSVAFMYSMLQYAKDDTAYRRRILQKVDYYSQKAAVYAIPGEFDNLIGIIGGTGLNAFTDYEKIVYHNSFPAENMNLWLDLYFERFSHAVFRLFETELETVYEEKNMSQDNMFVRVFEELYKNFYPGSIYGKQTVLGSVEHLKNPSLYNMETYYKNYYVANNMALVLSGNFDSQRTIELINNTFGKYRDGENIKLPFENEKPFDGKKIAAARLTPIPVGILGYRTVKNFDADKPALEIITAMLNNENNTGFLDSLNKNNKLMFSMVINDNHSDLGGLFIAYAPKFPFQSLKKAESMIISQLERIKKGDFSEEFLQAIKKGLKKDYELNLESQSYRMRLIAEAFVSGVTVNKMFENAKRIESLTKSDIVVAANKYFTDNYLAFYSKTGFPKNTKLKKPDVTPVKPEKGIHSDYYKNFVQNISNNVIPKFLTQNIDYKTEEIQQNANFYYTSNPYNSIFSFKLKFYVGEHTIPGLSFAAEFLNTTGTQNQDFQKFRKQLQLMGTEISATASENYFTITMTGFDENFNQSMAMLQTLLMTPGNNDKIVKQFISERRMDNKILKRDATRQSNLLTNFSIYGNNSPYLNRISIGDIKKLDSKALINMIKTAISYKVDISYAGTIPFNDMRSIIVNSGLIPINPTHNEPYIKPLIVPEKYVVYHLDNKKAVQSQIRIIVPSKPLWQEERLGINPFNKYFGTGLNAVVFREIREYRSLAYSAWAYYRAPYKFSEPTYLYCSTSTQADKTIEAAGTFIGIIDSMPQEPQQAKVIKYSLLNSFNNKLPDFRNMADYLAYNKLQGYKNDNRKELFDYYSRMQWNNIYNFYESNVMGRIRIMTIVGNKSGYDFDKLSQFGDVKEVKIKTLFTK